MILYTSVFYLPSKRIVSNFVGDIRWCGTLRGVALSHCGSGTFLYNLNLLNSMLSTKRKRAGYALVLLCAVSDSHAIYKCGCRVYLLRYLAGPKLISTFAATLSLCIKIYRKYTLVSWLTLALKCVACPMPNLLADWMLSELRSTTLFAQKALMSTVLSEYRISSTTTSFVSFISKKRLLPESE